MTGGVDMIKQATDLKAIPHLVIATPGRLAQLLDTDATGEISEYLDNLQFLVLDEADRMLTDDTI